MTEFELTLTSQSSTLTTMPWGVPSQREIKECACMHTHTHTHTHSEHINRLKTIFANQKSAHVLTNRAR